MPTCISRQLVRPVAPGEFCITDICTNPVKSNAPARHTCKHRRLQMCYRVTLALRACSSSTRPGSW